MTDVVQRMAGPASDTVPLGRFPVEAPDADDFGPNDVVVFKPAAKDIAALPTASRRLVEAAIERLRNGTARALMEPKEREPLLGTYTLRVTTSLRVGFYLSGQNDDWHVYWVGEHNYVEAERRFWNSPGYVRFAHPSHQNFRRAAGLNGDLPADVVWSVSLDEDWGVARAFAHLGGPEIGKLVWSIVTGEVAQVAVTGAYQRKGIATALWERAKAADSRLHHSGTQTPDGTAWVEKVGGLNGDLPTGISYRHEIRDWHDDGDVQHFLWATHPEAGTLYGVEHLLGWITWTNRTIDGVTVVPDYKRRGVATELLRRARQITPGIQHSDSFSPEGWAWSRVTAGLRGDLPEGLTFVDGGPGDLPEDYPWRAATSGEHEIRAILNGKVIGQIMWLTHVNPVAGIKVGHISRAGVMGDYQRRGIASEMLRRARAIDPTVHHSHTLTDEGKAWSEKVAGLPSLIHRGVRYTLTEANVTAWAESNPEKRAQILLDSIQRGRTDEGLGRHWSTDQHWAREWATRHINVETDPVIHAVLTIVDPGVAETDPDVLRERGVGQYQDEPEVTLVPGTPVHVVSLSWYSTGADEWITQPVSLHRTASAEDEAIAAWRANNLVKHDGEPGHPAIDHFGVPVRPKPLFVNGREVEVRPNRAVPNLLHAEIDGHIVGTISWSEGTIDRVEVDPAHQREGIATFLLAHARWKEPGLSHSDNLTPEGRAWAQHVGSLEGWRPSVGMFEPGRPTLDPRVFDLATEVIREDVRAGVVADLDDILSVRYPDWAAWTTVYIAGSGASHWWDSDTDLDVLLGLDLPALVASRPANAGLSEEVVCRTLTAFLKESKALTAARWYADDSGPWDTTYFYNPGSHDIANLKPYAAYDLLANRWVQRPPRLPADWGPASAPLAAMWPMVEQVAREAEAVLAIADPAARAQAGIAFFDMVHAWRHLAYTPAGDGWLDFGNVLYQYLALRPDHILRRLYLCKHPEEMVATASTKQFVDMIADVAKINGREGDRYSSFYDLIAREGKAYPKVATAAQISAKGLPKGNQGQCFQNAATIAFQNPDLTYVEGYADMGVMPLAHAWVVDSSGLVYDTTWEHGRGRDYFGIPVSTAFLREHVHKSMVWGLFAGEPGKRDANTKLLRKGLPKAAALSVRYRMRPGSGATVVVEAYLPDVYPGTSSPDVPVGKLEIASESLLGDYPQGMIRWISVDPEHQRQGIGRAMLEYARAHLPYPVVHSHWQTGDGKAFEQHTGALTGERGVDSFGHPVQRDDLDGWTHLDGSVTEDDYSAITDHPVHTAALKPLPPGYTIEVFERPVDNRDLPWHGLPGLYVEVKHEGKRVSGLGAFQTGDGTSSVNIWVDEQHQRKGVAMAMYAEIHKRWPTVPIKHQEHRSNDARALDPALRAEFGSHLHLGSKTADASRVDYKPERPLTGVGTVPLATYLSRATYHAFEDAPWMADLDAAMGTHADDSGYVAKRAAFFARIPASTVSLSAPLVVTQRTVNVARVTQIAQDPATGGTEPIWLVLHGGKYWVLNGHHRLAADWARGDEGFTAKVWVAPQGRTAAGSLPTGLHLHFESRFANPTVQAYVPRPGKDAVEPAVGNSMPSGRLIGFIEWFDRDRRLDGVAHKAGEVNWLYVDEEFRRKGVAKAMWDAALASPAPVKPVHSPTRSDDGDAFARAVSPGVAPRTHDYTDGGQVVPLHTGAVAAGTTWWHVTDKARFEIDEVYAAKGAHPSDANFRHQPGLWITPNPELWHYLWRANSYGQSLYAAEIDVSGLREGTDFHRMGQDDDDRDQWWMGPDAAAKAKVKRVVPVKTAEAEARRRGYAFALLSRDAIDDTRICVVDHRKGWGNEVALCGGVTFGEPIAWTTAKAAATKFAVQARNFCPECLAKIKRVAKTGMVTTALGLVSDGLTFRKAAPYDDNTQGIAAYVDGKKVGVIHWEATEIVAPIGEIVWVSVEPQWRRKGIATALLAKAREIEPRVHHSGLQSADGKAWGRAAASLRVGSITLKTMHNPVKAPKTTGYGQDIEPAGRYLTEMTPGARPPAGWVLGEVTFANPLRIEWGEGYDSPTSWKRVLHQRYAKTGAALSAAIRADGYDAIITFDKYGTSEIVDLRPRSATGIAAKADTLMLTDGTNALEYAAADGEPLILSGYEGAPDALLAELRSAHPEAIIVPGTAAVADSAWWARIQHTAGVRGDLPDLTFTIKDGTWQGQYSGKRWIKAFVDGRMVGSLGWFVRPERHWAKGEIVSIEVDPDWQRKGIATAMLAAARADDPTVHHGPIQTDDGKAWSTKAAGLNGPLPAGLECRLIEPTASLGGWEGGWSICRAYVDDTVVGELIVTDRGNISWVNVFEDHMQRRGIATEMLKAVRAIRPVEHGELNAHSRPWAAVVGSQGSLE